MVMRKVLQTKGVKGDVSIISIENNGYVQDDMPLSDCSDDIE